MTTKRINLSFSIDREDDLKVYRILSEQKYKTDYVIKAVLSFMEKGDKTLLDKEKIKEAVKEAIAEYGGIPESNNKKEDRTSNQCELPDNIFDMFNNL